MAIPPVPSSHSTILHLIPFIVRHLGNSIIQIAIGSHAWPLLPRNHISSLFFLCALRLDVPATQQSMCSWWSCAAFAFSGSARMNVQMYLMSLHLPSTLRPVAVACAVSNQAAQTLHLEFFEFQIHVCLVSSFLSTLRNEASVLHLFCQSSRYETFVIFVVPSCHRYSQSLLHSSDALDWI